MLDTFYFEGFLVANTAVMSVNPVKFSDWIMSV